MNFNWVVNEFVKHALLEDSIDPYIFQLDLLVFAEEPLLDHCNEFIETQILVHPKKMRCSIFVLKLQVTWKVFAFRLSLKTNIGPLVPFQDLRSNHKAITVRVEYISVEC